MSKQNGHGSGKKVVVPPSFKGVSGVEHDKGVGEYSSRGAGIGNDPGVCIFSPSQTQRG